MEKPSLPERYGSLLVDLITMIILILLLANTPSPVKYIALVIPVVYFPVLHTLLSRSVGDTVFRLTVVDRHGNKIGFRLALERFKCVFKYSVFAMLFTNILFLLFAILSGTVRDIREISFDYEEESKTYLIKA